VTDNRDFEIIYSTL